jgi:5S rRNA maturation endonuclease (ribonuclease M5)
MQMKKALERNMQEVLIPSWIKISNGCKMDPSTEYRDWGKVKIYRETARKFFLVGAVELGLDGDRTQIPQILSQKLMRLFAKRSSLPLNRFLQEIAPDAVKIGIDTDLLVNNLISSGHLAKWVRYAIDGISEVSVVVGPGLALEEILKKKRDTNFEQILDWVISQKNRLCSLENYEFPNLSPKQTKSIFNIQDSVSNALRDLGDFLSENRDAPALVDGDSWSRFSFNKIPNGFIMGVEFMLSLANALMQNAEGFDWKEIGATSYEEIGGSKRFDSNKESLIKLTEQILENSLSDIGLLSNGSLYSIYLAGEYHVHYLDGSEDNRTRPGLYAISNIQAEEIKNISTPGEVVICTENRALLLKMYKSKWLQESKVLVVGIDGQVKGAHENLLRLLQANPDLQFFIWPDTDKAGTIIANKLKNVLPYAELVSVNYEDKNIITTSSYIEWLNILSTSNMQEREQENYLGNSDVWDKVFKK